MRIACNRCRSEYDIPDERLSRGAAKVRCSACGHTFAIRTRPTGVSRPGPDQPDWPGLGSSGMVEPPEETPRAWFDDIDFDLDSAPAEAPESPSGARAAGGAAADLDAPEEEAADTLAAIGELDLGDFDDLERALDLDLRGDPLSAVPASPEPPVRVQEDDLLSRRHRGAPEPGSDAAPPRLDIQRGTRRPEPKARPSPLVARDRRRSPLFWVVIAAAAATLTYTGYNLYLHPEAFTFLSPAKVRSLWHNRQMEAVLGIEDLSGYYRDLRADRRLFVIRGEVVNRSSGAQSLIRVQGNLFGKDGKPLATREVFCGNVLSDAELETLSDRDIEARLQNEVGDAMQNMEVAPGARVPFTVVFPSPPDGVDKFSVRPVHTRPDPGT